VLEARPEGPVPGLVVTSAGCDARRRGPRCSARCSA
jgi:hypothetical protein